MTWYFQLFLLVSITPGCKEKPAPSPLAVNKSVDEMTTDHFYATIGDIKTPKGFTRTDVPHDSFAGWLRSVPLKKDKTVYLYNGTRKRNQSAQFAVIDIPTGNKDLQQCADVVMRLRAEYLFRHKIYPDIAFM